MRGEYQVVYQLPADESGSPPTCVGNTPCKMDPDILSEDHPHLRGEYLCLCSRDHGSVESPPLAWGIPDSLNHRINYGRITPTCVGNTKFNGIWNSKSKDHPHLRGEYLIRIIAVFV